MHRFVIAALVIVGGTAGLFPASLSAQTTPQAGELIVTEIMYNPGAVPDVTGEWFEIYNISGVTLELAGLVFKDAGTDSFSIPTSPSVPLAAGQFFVLGREGDSGLNGGVDVGFDYDDEWVLANTDDEIIIRSGATIVDEVWYDTGDGFPDATDASIGLLLDYYNATDNDIGANWTETPHQSAYLLSGGDYATPGWFGASASVLYIFSVSPDSGPMTGGTAVSIYGVGFTGAVDVLFGGTSSSQWWVINDGRIDCQTPAHADGVVDIRVISITASDVLPGAFTYIKNVADWAELVSPADIELRWGETTPDIIGQIWEPGITDAPGVGAGVVAELGCGPGLTDPRNASGWTWVAATYQGDIGNDDRYVATLTPTVHGDWSYVYRFSLDGGATFSYADLSPGTANGFEVADMGKLTVWGTPSILSIEDIPADQGGQVRLIWERAACDAPDVTPDITGYAIFRGMDPAAKAAAGDTGAGDPLLKPHLSGWDYLATVPAFGEDEYQYVAPTLCDSSVAAGQCWSTFVVRAMTPSPFEFFDSAPDSGYSIDNLAPAVPAAVQAAYHPGSVTLEWEDALEADFQYYRIYRGADAGFIPAAGTLVGQSATSDWTDAVVDAWGYHYKITALDFAGNESEAASPAAVSGVRANDLPTRFALYPNVPNPFNPMTTICFDLPESAPVTLSIFDVSGRLVRTLLNGETIAAGYREAVWRGDDEAGRLVPSGVYLYRLEAGKFMQSRRMLLIK